MHVSALGMVVDVYNLFSDQEEISIEQMDIADVDSEEEPETEKEGNEGKEGEEKEGEDADEKDYYALNHFLNRFVKNLSLVDGYYLQSQYSVILNITVEPPELT